MRCSIGLGTVVSAVVLFTVVNAAPSQFYATTGVPAMIRVIVPSPDANVWVEDVLIPRPKGTCRLFASPPLEAGHTYTYTFKASWLEKGRQVTAKRRVRFQPGELKTVSFLEQPARLEREPSKPGSEADQDRPLTPPMAPEPGRQPPSEEDRPLTPPLAHERSGI